MLALIQRADENDAFKSRNGVLISRRKFPRCSNLERRAVEERKAEITAVGRNSFTHISEILQTYSRHGQQGLVHLSKENSSRTGLKVKGSTGPNSSKIKGITSAKHSIKLLRHKRLWECVAVPRRRARQLSGTRQSTGPYLFHIFHAEKYSESGIHAQISVIS